MKSKLISKFIKSVGKKYIFGDGVLLTESHVFATSPEVSLVVRNDFSENNNNIKPSVISFVDALMHGKDLNAVYPSLTVSTVFADVLKERFESLILESPVTAKICEINAAKLFNKAYLTVMGKADVRYYLNSQFVSFTDKSINTAVSDGYRLVTDKLDVPCKHLIDVLIPRNAVEILSIIDADVDVYVRYTKEGNLSVIEFNGVDFALYVTPINSKYPSFDRLMAQYVNNKLTTVTVKRKEMLKGLKANRNSLITVARAKGVTVILDGNDLIFHDIADHEKKTLFSTKANRDNNTKGIQVVGKFECDYLIDLLTIEKANDIEILFTETCAVIEKANGVNIVMGRRD
jgi:hypothetical protein